MRTALIGILLSLIAAAGPVFGQAAAEPSSETAAAFVERLRTALQSGDRPAYLGGFPEDARAGESARLDVYSGEMAMTGLTLRTVGVRTDGPDVARAFVQAYFENDYSALIEAWTVSLERSGGAWRVAGREVTGNPTRLLKVRVPGERAVRARRLEIGHADIRAVFEDAAVFYDNIPGLDTALVVVGRGRVSFTPGDANEKHQLELLYKRDRIEREIESLYVRCSPSFFASRVRIETAPGGPDVSSAERDKAAAVFARNYPRAFTIESSIDGSLLSFLPQGDEAGLSFKLRRGAEMAYIFSPFADDEVSLYDHAKERIVCLYTPREPDEGPPLKRMVLSFDEKFDVTTYSLDLSFTPASSYLSARARIEVVPRVDALDTLKLRFNPDLEILKITDALDRELFYTQDRVRRTLYVHLVEPPMGRDPVPVEIFYRGVMRPASPTTDVIAQTGAGGGSIRVRPRYETYFYSHAGHWYPGPVEEDYFLARLTLVVPPGYECVANGELVARGRREDLDDAVAVEKAGGSVFTFVSRAPLKYMSFIVGKFGPERKRPGAVPLSAFVSTEVMDTRPGLLDQAADILDFYGRAFGPYPYEKLGIVLRLWPAAGGHSPASFIVINDLPWFGDSGFPSPADTPVDLSGWDEYFLAHEIAHQWWGQGVSFGTHKDQWLSEGLAQFASASYLRHRYGEAAYAAILRKFARWTARKSVRGPILMGSRLSYFDYEAYQAIVYDKAALALFMLQDLLGRETFEAGLRSFFEKKKFGPARTADFVAAMAAASGRDLKAFFAGWFEDWRLPDVRTSWTETTVPEGVRVDFRVTQLAGTFVFPLWIETRRGSETRRHLVVVDEKVERFSLVLPRKPDRVVVNPDRAVPGQFD